MQKNMLIAFGSKISRIPIVLFLLFLVVVFSLTSEYFLTYRNFYNILLQASTVGLLGLGLGFVIMNGNIDLSVGSLLGLSSAVFVRVANVSSFGTAILVTLLVGILVGAFNGFCVTRLKINAFIVTLGSMIGVKGAVFVITKELSISLKDFSFTNLSSVNFLGISVLSWTYVLVMLVLAYIQNYTTHGRNVYFVGGNKKAARAAGININSHQFINFVVCSFITACAGILLTSQLGATTPNTGRTYELWAIASVALGGIKLTGGVGKIQLVFLGGITIGVLRNGMSLLRLGTSYIFVVTGLVLLLVMILTQYLGEFHAVLGKIKKLGKNSTREEYNREVR